MSWNPHAKDPSSEERHLCLACVPSTAARSVWLKKCFSIGFKIEFPNIPTPIALSKQSVTWELSEVLASSTTSEQTVNTKFGSICKDTEFSQIFPVWIWMTLLLVISESNVSSILHYISSIWHCEYQWGILSRRLLCNDWTLMTFFYLHQKINHEKDACNFNFSK